MDPNTPVPVQSIIYDMEMDLMGQLNRLRTLRDFLADEKIAPGELQGRIDRFVHRLSQKDPRRIIEKLTTPSEIACLAILQSVGKGGRVK